MASACHKGTGWPSRCSANHTSSVPASMPANCQARARSSTPRRWFSRRIWASRRAPSIITAMRWSSPKMRLAAPSSSRRWLRRGEREQHRHRQRQQQASRMAWPPVSMASSSISTPSTENRYWASSVTITSTTTLAATAVVSCLQACQADADQFAADAGGGQQAADRARRPRSTTETQAGTAAGIGRRQQHAPALRIEQQRHGVEGHQQQQQPAALRQDVRDVADTLVCHRGGQAEQAEQAGEIGNPFHLCFRRAPGRRTRRQSCRAVAPLLPSRHARAATTGAASSSAWR